MKSRAICSFGKFLLLSTMVNESQNKTLLVEFVMRFARFQGVFGACILFLGFTGNILICVTVYFLRSMRASTKILFIFLAITDNLALLNPGIRTWLHVTFNIYSFTGYSPAQCRIMYFSAKLMLCLSAWTIVLMSLERFVSVYFPTKTIFNDPKRIGLLLFFQASVLCLVYSYTFTMKHKGANCIPSFSIPIQAAVFVDGFVRLFLPITVTVVLCALILHKIKKKKTRVSDSISQPERDRTSNPIKMLLGASLFEAVVGFPSGMALQFFGFSKVPLKHEDFGLFYRCIEVFLLTNNAVNFGIYLLVSRTFRLTFYAKLRACLGMKFEESPLPLSATSESRKRTEN